MNILQAAYKVLSAERRPMSAEEVTRRCILKKFDVNAPEAFDRLCNMAIRFKRMDEKFGA